MRKLLLLGALLASPAFAVGPRFSTTGGVGSATSSYSGAELTGGSYSINGTTGIISSPSLPIDPRSFGAKCDGSTDDTVALRAWAASATTGSHLKLPDSACKFTGPIAFPLVNNVSLTGSGRQSQLLYAGSATTGTLITIGGTTLQANFCSIQSWSIAGLKVASNTVMTGGDGLLVQNACEMDFDNIAVGGDIDGNQNLWNGIHFSGGNSDHMRGYSFAAKNIAEIINGTSTQQFVDMYQIQGKISHSGMGLDIAGNMGGFVMDQTDILLNGINVQIDQSQTASPNEQVFFGSTTAIDQTNGSSSSPNIGINVTDPGADVISQVFFSGTWLASTVKVAGVTNSGTCLHIASTATQWGIHLSGGTIYNCGSDGILNESSTSRITVQGTYIAGAGRYGVNSTVANPYLQIIGIPWPVFYDVNTTANLGGNASTAAGISCTGAPTSSFAVTYGQVTHC